MQAKPFLNKQHQFCYGIAIQRQAGAELCQAKAVLCQPATKHILQIFKSVFSEFPAAFKSHLRLDLAFNIVKISKLILSSTGVDLQKLQSKFSDFQLLNVSSIEVVFPEVCLPSFQNSNFKIIMSCTGVDLQMS